MMILKRMQTVLFGGLAAVFFARSAVADTDSPVFPTAYTNGTEGAPDERPYWVQLDDGTLKALVEKGLSQNFDLKAVEERIRQSEALARGTKAPLLPALNAEAAWNIRQFESPGMGYTSPATAAMAAAAAAAGVPAGDVPGALQSVTTSLKATWIADITGRNTLNKNAAYIETDALRNDASTQATSLAQLIASAYFNVAVAEVRMDVAEEQIATSQDFLELVEAQFEAGSANALDVLQQRQNLEAAKGRLFLVRQVLETSKQQLAVLLGAESTAVLPVVAALLPEPTPLPPTGTPERLLDARPELRAASTRIQALALREKAAFRTLLPSLAVSGQVGYQVNYSEDADHGEVWSLAALLSVPLYQGGAIKSGLDRARASTRAEIMSLQQAAYKAVGEVESALIRDREQQAYIASIHQQLETSRIAFEEAKARYTVGLSNYLNVLTALATHQSVQLTKVQAHLDWIVIRISLLNALGGEWSKQLVNGR